MERYTFKCHNFVSDKHVFYGKTINKSFARHSENASFLRNFWNNGNRLYDPRTNKNVICRMKIVLHATARACLLIHSQNIQCATKLMKNGILKTRTSTSIQNTEASLSVRIACILIGLRRALPKGNRWTNTSRQAYHICKQITDVRIWVTDCPNLGQGDHWRPNCFQFWVHSIFTRMVNFG